MANTAGTPPRIIVVDGSKVVRRLITGLLQKELQSPEVVACDSGADALAAVKERDVDLVTTALRLPDMDGLEFSRRLRDAGRQRYFPVVVVSGDVTARLHREGNLAGVTDYFDKSHGFEALGAFIRGYVNPDAEITGRVLFIEDSRVVVMATTRMMEKNGLDVTHRGSIEEALEILEAAPAPAEACDLLLTDVYLKGGLTAHDLLRRLRAELSTGPQALPVLVITGESDSRHHAELLRLGANDVVEKPIREALLTTKLRFQLQVRRQARAHAGED